MKKKRIFTITLILLMTLTTMVNANSGPTYWEGYPSSEILSIQRNSSIVIEKEDLIFDFSNDKYINNGGNSISGLVTAKYKMSNPTNDKQTVQMAFPIVSSLESFNPEDIVIKVDGSIIPFEVYMGNEVKRKGREEENQKDETFDFDSIVKSISNETYSPLYYDLNAVGTLYTYDVIPTVGNEVNFVVDYNCDYEKTKIISKGFNGYSENNNEARITAWIRDKESLEIFVLGENVDFNISAFLNGELTQKTEDYYYELKSENISIKDFLIKETENYKEDKYNSYLPDNQFFNLYSKELDDIFSHNVGYLWVDDSFLSLDYLERIFVLLYEVDFPSQSKKDISVSYIARGTMDKTLTVDSLYTFDYILNPAKNWAGFENLHIEIKPPKEHPYIVESSVDLVRDEAGLYTGKFDTLPEKDLSFTLYSKEEITLLDKVGSYANNSSRIILFAIVPFVASLITSTMIRMYLKGRKKKS